MEEGNANNLFNPNWKLICIIYFYQQNEKKQKA